MARTRDSGAEGRAAALEVRKAKARARRDLVGEFARRRHERGRSELSISQAVRLVERASGVRWAHGTIAGDLRARELAQPPGPRRKLPKPEPRECEGCGETFTPKDASQVARGHGRYCSQACYRRSDARRDVGRRAARERHERADAEVARLNEDGLLTTRQAAEELGVTESTLYERYGNLLEPVERRLVEGEHLRLVRARDVKTLARRRLASARVRHYADAAVYLVHAAKLGVSLERAQALHEARDDARVRHGRIRVGTGRPRSAGPPAHHCEWAERFGGLHAALSEQHLEDRANGFDDPPPTNFGVAGLVAEDDFAQYPERWTYDPKDAPREAARRVWEAVKPLLSLVSETRAA